MDEEEESEMASDSFGSVEIPSLTSFFFMMGE